MNYSDIILLLLSAFTGTLSAWILRKKTFSSLLNILLSFSGAYLLGVVILHLLPDIFHAADDEHTAVFILIGFFVQLLIVQLSRGVEHGHLHIHEQKQTKYVLSVMIGLSIHAFMEGLPLATDNYGDVNSPILWGIIIHKIPESFALATILFFSFRKILYAFICMLLFSLMTPFGIIIGNYYQQIENDNMHLLLAIVCGSLIHISTTIIFEAGGKAHRISIYKFFAIIAGAAISLISIGH